MSSPKDQTMSALRAPSLATAATAILAVLAAALAMPAGAQMCGSEAGGALCANCLCCSKYGFCGSTADYCGAGCQSQCSGCAPTPPPGAPPPPPPPAPPSPPAGPGVGSILSRELFEQMLLHRNAEACLAHGFYTYDNFLEAAAAFPAFGGTMEGLSTETRKREVAAFLGQTSHETTGGWSDAPDGPFAWGYCWKRERFPESIYCDTDKPDWPCAPGKEYVGRGPIQLTWNYNYGQAGCALGVDLLGNPDLVETDQVLSFKTALWFWMTPQANKPSSHAVITGQWTPTPADTAAGRVPGYGVITNIINGGVECGQGPNDKVADRIGFYQRYCDILGVGTGINLDCYDQRPFTEGFSAAQ